MTDQERVERIFSIVRGFPALKERVPPFKRPPEFQGRAGGEATYDWLVNTWIPGQPDFKEIMELTILMDFQLQLVVAGLMGEDRLLEELRKERKP